MLGFITTYGNGFKKVYIPHNNSNNNAYIPLTGEEREKENRRLRAVKTKQNILQRGMSVDSFKYFSTLTTDNKDLFLNPKKFLKLANKFLKNEIKINNYKSNNYILVLECFEQEINGFHLHCVSDFNIDLIKFYLKFSSNSCNNTKELEENLNEKWILNNNDIFKNLYCKKLKYLGKLPNEEAIAKAMGYVTKKIKKTKERMEELYPNARLTLYASNIKKINRNVEEFDFDLDDFDLDDFLIEDNDTTVTSSFSNDDKGFSGNAYNNKNAKSVLNVRGEGNKSNTRRSGSSDCVYRPISIAKNLTVQTFLLKFIGYIFNIPEFFKII